MKAEKRIEILNLLDLERQTIIYPAVTRFSEAGVIRDISNGGKTAEIVFSASTEAEVEQNINTQIAKARREGYELEWKLYGHDQPVTLGEYLTAAGFEAGNREAFMVFSANDESLARFGKCDADIRKVTTENGLDDVQSIMEDVSKSSREKQIEQYRFMLENHPENMSIYVAYIDGEPAACGRTYFHKDSQFAGLYGGQTREKFRNRGLFTQLVATRIQEAMNRGLFLICVDALPTSEPILKKRGFEIVTYTQPFNLSV